MRSPQPRPLAAALAAAALAVLLAPAEAGAIPAFARRQRLSCTTCHDPFPRLKAYGEEFAARGFALEPGQDPARARIDVGDPLLELPREFPLALRFDAYALAREGSPRVDLQTPWALKLLTGGQIAAGVGFYGYYILEQGEPGKFEDAYVQLSSPLGLPVNLLVGQFQLSDPIAKRELRLERLDYQILRARVGASSVDLTYDRGVILSAGFPFVDAVLSVTNGTGIGPGEGGTLDRDRFKNFSLHLATDLGPVRAGAFGFVGHEAGAGGEVNRTTYAGPQVGLEAWDRLTLSLVYLERRDTNPELAAGGGGEVETRGGFAEVVLRPLGPDGRLAVVGLYNRVESDLAATDAESAAVAASWLHRRNVRLVAEVAFDLAAEAWSGSVGTVAAF